MSSEYGTWSLAFGMKKMALILGGECKVHITHSSIRDFSSPVDRKVSISNH